MRGYLFVSLSRINDLKLTLCRLPKIINPGIIDVIKCRFPLQRLQAFPDRIFFLLLFSLDHEIGYTPMRREAMYIIPNTERGKITTWYPESCTPVP